MKKITYEELEKKVKDLEAVLEGGNQFNEGHFLASLESVNVAMNDAVEVEHVIDKVLDAVSLVFGCDRIWLFHPCDPNASSFKVLAEKNKQEYPGAFVTGQELPITTEAADSIKKALKARAPVVFHPGSENKLDDVAIQFSVRSQIVMAIHPVQGDPWMFGMHQCSYARLWTGYEQTLFKEISYRVVEGLNNLILLRDLKVSEKKYRRFVESIFNGWAYHKIVLDSKKKPVDYLVLEVNKSFEQQTGLKRDDIIGKRITEILPGIEKDPADWIGRYGNVALTGESIKFDKYSESINKWYTVTASSPEPGYFITVFSDISEIKKLEQEKEEIIGELQSAIGEIKTLSGFLPICASCKGIRDDDGYWNKLESYIMNHSEAVLSHTVCPECAKKLYPDLVDENGGILD